MHENFILNSKKAEVYSVERLSLYSASPDMNVCM